MYAFAEFLNFGKLKITVNFTEWAFLLLLPIALAKQTRCLLGAEA